MKLFLICFAVVLSVLKFAEVLAISWGVALAPVWLPIVVCLVLYAVWSIVALSVAAAADRGWVAERRALWFVDRTERFAVYLAKKSNVDIRISQ